MKKKKSKKKTSFISKTAMTVLTIILIILFFCIMSMVEKIQGTARVVNYAGLVRGKTQRIIKLEDAGEPQDTMIADINAYIDGLQNGSSELDLVRLDDRDFQDKMTELASYFEELKETCPSGYFTAPSVGAGTANTEFEVITQMNVQDFGTGEYPYKTILQETPCESIAYDLKKLGLASHVIHNNTATFYDRNIVFPKLGFDSFTTLEYMNHVETNEIGWAKDKILTKEIVRALSETEERDFIYTISVQPHGAYPEESETADIKVLSGIEDPALRGQMEYYATQIHEVDEFLRTLTDVLTTWEEPTVLVLYGDHMPSLEISKDMLDLSAGGLFETEYVIWSNCGVGGADRNVKAYQLSSRVLELLDINVGTLTKFHQLNPWRGAYETELRTLQYDMLYGDRVVYHGEQPFEETDMRFGTRDITVNTAYVQNDMLMVRGKNFTPYSVIYVDGNAKETTFLSEYAVTCAADGIEKGDRVTVRQVAEDGTELSEAIADPYGD